MCEVISHSKSQKLTHLIAELPTFNCNQLILQYNAVSCAISNDAFVRKFIFTYLYIYK